LNPVVLLDDLLEGFGRNTPHFEKLFCTLISTRDYAPQLIQNMVACNAWSSGRKRFPIYFRFLFARFLVCLRGLNFYLRGFFFVCVVSFLICVASLLFAACPL